MSIQAQERTIDSANPERPQDTVASFTTSHGSTYTYDDQGYATRFKTASGEEQPRQDITVFFNLTPRDLSTAAAAYLLRSSTEKSKVEVIEQQLDGQIRVITDIHEVKLPDQLMVATLRGDKVVRSKPTSLMPRIGAHVFDSRQFEEDGIVKTERHLGHKIIDIRYKE
jgi:hypothetical protein